MTGLEGLRDAALEAVEAASAVVRRRVAEGQVAERKDEGDYVTPADREAEAAAVRVLRRRAPGIPVVGEEGGHPFEQSRCWLVDPIDGTTNFVRRFPVVGVSVAYVDEGRPRVGVVAAPLLRARWSAVEGGGAFDHQRRRLAVGGARGRGVVATGFPFRGRKDRLVEYLPVMTEALRRFEDLRRTGSAALDLAFIAAGTWDGFFELGLGPWDVAAGALLVREAGGRVSDWHGDESAVVASGDVLAGTPRCHDTLLEIAGRHAAGA